MNKEIADIVYKMLEYYEDSIQHEKDFWNTDKEYADCEKLKEWLDTARIGKFPNALPFKETLGKS
jgi:hypothetical protein